MSTQARYTKPWKINQDWDYGNFTVSKGRRAFTKEENKANFNLLKAAPELYEELFRALAVIQSPESFELEQVISDIRRVLAKARGE